MKIRLKKIIISLVLFLFAGTSVMAQTSSSSYRRSGVLDGNQVKTVFRNNGVIGQPAQVGFRGAWLFGTNGYIGDVSPLVGAEVNGYFRTAQGTDVDTTFFWVIDCPAARPSGPKDFSSDGTTRQAFEPVYGYFNDQSSSPALSNNPASWPPIWPDKAGDLTDPGWPNSWNGLFGKIPSADLETFFVMDDDNDNEFSVPEENDFNFWFKPDPMNPNRNGLGLEVRVRGLQWQQILAQDNIFWVYEITNNGQYTYPRTVFGMLVGTYVGVTGGDDSPNEFDDDWSFFDPYENLTFTGDYDQSASRNPFWQGPVGMVGYAFLESPGNPYDGIDNDNDAASAGLLPSAPYFEAEDFDPVTVTNNSSPGPGQVNQFVLINPDTYEREIVTFPTDQDTFTVVSMGDTIQLISDLTVLVEGNVLNPGTRKAEANPNAYDGKDNDLDGLIDENYFLHFNPRRVDNNGNILFDLQTPTRHIDYLSGMGTSDAMVDERRDDGIDNDRDWSRNPETGTPLFDDKGNLLDDVGADGIPYTGDTGENDGMPSAGEPNFDKTDKDESDQIGLTSFNYFTPAGEIQLGDDNQMWSDLRPGYFNVPDAFRNGRPQKGEDGDFTYSSGYFPLASGQTERMSLALIYAFPVGRFGTADLVKKLRTVRNIYNADYRFPKAPDKPTLTAVAASDSVILYWDRLAESSFDPVLREYDFEGYRIYRSTDPNFNDARVITNSAGTVVGYKPIAQFDLRDNVSGWFEPPYEILQLLQGWTYNLGEETGLQHSYVDKDVENGQTYYYAVVSYDKGVDTMGVIPSECTKKITQLGSGDVVLDINTAKVTPHSVAAGYKAPKMNGAVVHLTGDGFGTVDFKVIDPTALTGHQYEVRFWDTSNDGIDNNGNWKLSDDVGADGVAGTGDLGEGDGVPTTGEPNFDYNDIKELESITTHYSVKDLYKFQEDWEPDDTNFVALQHKNLVRGSLTLQKGSGEVVDTTLYIVDFKKGTLRAKTPAALPVDFYRVSYQYYPVYFSTLIKGSPYINNFAESDFFDGLVLQFDNVWKTEKDTTGSGFTNSAIKYSFNTAFSPVQDPNTGTVYKPIFFPSNYEVRFSDDVVDSSSNFFNTPLIPPTARKFQIYNLTGNYQIEYVHLDTNGDSTLSALEPVWFFEKGLSGDFNVYTWQLQITTDDPEYKYVFKEGDVLKLNAKFPFNKFDKFAFQTEVPTIDRGLAKDDLKNIRVFPNPYIVSHRFEPALPPSITSGRGERRIYFTNVPQDARIHIFTVRGDEIATLKNDGSQYNGTVIWDLKTSENLNIAYGVYFYVIESDAGTKKGKLAVIK